MSVQMETAASKGSIFGNGGSVISKAVVAQNYPNTRASATEFAAAVVAARFRVSPCIARVICELAQIGGRLA